MSDYTVHDEPNFARVYDEDEMISVRKGDLRALLDLATGSMNFASGFWDNEQCEIARGIAKLLGIDPVVVTPYNLECSYGIHEFWTLKEKVNHRKVYPKSTTNYNECKRWDCHVVRSETESLEGE